MSLPTTLFPDLLEPPEIRRKSEIPSGIVFLTEYGEGLRVVKSYGTDDAAPVIVEHINGRHIKQYAIHSSRSVHYHLDRLTILPRRR